jgi:hypothetical protein
MSFFVERNYNKKRKYQKEGGCHWSVVIGHSFKKLSTLENTNDK